jgi:suppressor of ftsI
MHYHGMSVSPLGNSDNVFVHVHPGESFQYEVRIPAAGRQGPGLYWYHPHAHGYVDPQILGGLSGALVVDGFEELYPLLRGMSERFLLIKHAQIDGGEVVSISGQIIRRSPCAPATCSSGASPISVLRCSSSSASKAWRSM